MARGRQKKQAPSRSRPGRYGNGYGTVYMLIKQDVAGSRL